MTPNQIAHVAHAANRALQAEQADPTIPVSDQWENLDDETRASAIDGVNAVLAGASAEESHANWVKFKEAHGWTLGPVKDGARKEHPLLVAYGDLPPSQQAKDHLFGAIVSALR